MVTTIQPYIPAGSTVYADLDSYRASSNPPSTTPPDLYLTRYRPDMVIIGNDSATLLELTVCGDSSLAML